MTPTRFTVTPATTHEADVDAARVAQHLVDTMPTHVAEAAQTAGEQAHAQTGDPAEGERAARAVVRGWLFSGGP